MRSREPPVECIHDDKDDTSGNQDAVEPGGAGRLVFGGGGGWDEPELLGRHAAGAPEGGPGQDRGVRERVAAAEERRGLRRGLPELEIAH